MLQPTLRPQICWSRWKGQTIPASTSRCACARKRLCLSPLSTPNTPRFSKKFSNALSQVEHVVLAGDLNTVCQGIARCVPAVACDYRSRFGTLGWTEGEWFQRHAIEEGNSLYGTPPSFYEPFDKRKDITLTNGLGLYAAKLDWCILSTSLRTLSKKIGPLRSCSDHR